MTLEEFIETSEDNEELKKAFTEAAEAGSLDAFLKSHGVDATQEDLENYVMTGKLGELSDSELDDVSERRGLGDQLLKTIGGMWKH